MDDNVEKLARRKMKSDAMKRAFAINGQLDQKWIRMMCAWAEYEHTQTTPKRRRL
jgi:hypothetical protein